MLYELFSHLQSYVLKNPMDDGWQTFIASIKVYCDCFHEGERLRFDVQGTHLYVWITDIREFTLSWWGDVLYPLRIENAEGVFDYFRIEVE